MYFSELNDVADIQSFFLHNSRFCVSNWTGMQMTGYNAISAASFLNDLNKTSLFWQKEAFSLFSDSC